MCAVFCVYECVSRARTTNLVRLNPNLVRLNLNLVHVNPLSNMWWEHRNITPSPGTMHSIYMGGCVGELGNGGGHTDGHAEGKNVTDDVGTEAVFAQREVPVFLAKRAVSERMY